jgi:hypothetical protein
MDDNLPTTPAPQSEPSPLMSYFKKLFIGPLTDPFGKPPPFPLHRRPLTPEEEASPYRNPPRFFDIGPMSERALETYKQNGSVPDDDLAHLMAHGASFVAQPLPRHWRPCEHHPRNEIPAVSATDDADTSIKRLGNVTREQDGGRA